MRITAKVDYAVRALIVLASDSNQRAISAEGIAANQQIPQAFLLKILADLRAAELVRSRRGASGGYHLARTAEQICVADVIRAVEGPLADVHGLPPEDVDYPAPTTALREVWLATRVALRSILEETTLADLAHGSLPPLVIAALDQPGAATRR